MGQAATLALVQVGAVRLAALAGLAGCGGGASAPGWTATSPCPPPGWRRGGDDAAAILLAAAFLLMPMGRDPARRAGAGELPGAVWPALARSVVMALISAAR
jgi:thiamine transport system permease protein